MPLVYVGWFFFSGLWGYMAATTVFPPAQVALAPHIAFPLTAIGGVVVGVVSFLYSPNRALADRPSLRLTPWNRPTGFLLFVALTFTFTGIWALGMVVALGYPGLVASAHVLALGIGPLVGILLAPRFLPGRFKEQAATE